MKEPCNVPEIFDFLYFSSFYKLPKLCRHVKETKLGTNLDILFDPLAIW